jgi:large subunit ribosomal protein L17
MVTSLFRYERIRTTKAKALAVRRSAEKLITRAKVDGVHNRRIVSSRLFDEAIVAKLFTDIAPRMKERPGGYTRIIKLGERPGDASEIVILELVDYKLNVDKASDKKARKAAKEEKK